MGYDLHEQQYRYHAVLTFRVNIRKLKPGHKMDTGAAGQVGHESSPQLSTCQVLQEQEEAEDRATDAATPPTGRARRLKSFKGGYDCEFVERPTEVFQTECSICLQVLREPHIISCCGHSFCRACIEETKAAGKSCPLCNEPEFTLMHNKGLERSLKELHVHCIHKSLGCAWTGKLGELDQHLNVDPKPEKQQDGCEYAEVRCAHGCGESFRRPLLTKHQIDECLYRPFSCEFCHEYASTYADVVGKHFTVCPFYQITCPNYCTPYTFERHKLEKHLKDDCPLQVVNCSFAFAGCKVQLQRKDMPEHLREGMEHVSLLANLTQTLTSKILGRDTEIERLQNEVVELRLDFAKEKRDQREEIKALQQECRELRVNCANLTQYIPVKRILTNYGELKVHKKEWFSEAFYSHPKGYKMCLNVCPDGFGRHRGAYISVFVFFMKGEHDGTLAWPFRGIITIELLNQLEDKNHHSDTVVFDEETPSGCSLRVQDGQRAPHGWGTNMFIANDELIDSTQSIQYLQNDCLYFRVSKFEIVTRKNRNFTM